MPRRALLPFLTILLSVSQLACEDECKRASDCSIGQLCHRGACVPALNPELSCVTAADCSGRPCVRGRCELLAPPSASDAGVQPDSGIDLAECRQLPNVPLTAGALTTKDVDAPRVRDPSATPPAPGAGEEVLMRFTLLEDGCGLDSATGTLRAAAVGANAPTRIEVDFSRTLVGEEAQRLEGRLMTRTCLEPVVHRLTELRLRDYAGNESVYTYSDLAGDRVCTTPAPGTDCYRLSIGGAPSMTTDVPILSFTPTTPGSPPPTLTAVSGWRAVADQLVATVAVTEPQDCDVIRVDLTASNALRTLTRAGILSGFDASLRVPLCAPNTAFPWSLDVIELQDAASRSVRYTADGPGGTFLREDGASEGGVVPAAAEMAGGNDIASPAITRVVIRDEAVPDLGRRVFVEVNATDDSCGLGDVSGRMVGAFESSSGIRFEETMNASDRGANACIVIPRCAPADTYVFTGKLYDSGGASTELALDGMSYELIESDGSSGVAPADLVEVTTD